jgi:hypothetical protein
VAHRHHLHPGDRVHWPGDPRDRGTVIREENHLIVVWDRRVDDCREHDLSEIDHLGILLDIHEGRVWLHERPLTLELQRKSADAAERRLKAGQRAQATLEKQRAHAAEELDRRARAECSDQVRKARIKEQQDRYKRLTIR